MRIFRQNLPLVRENPDYGPMGAYFKYYVGNLKKSSSEEITNSRLRTFIVIVSSKCIIGIQLQFWDNTELSYGDLGGSSDVMERSLWPRLLGQSSGTSCKQLKLMETETITAYSLWKSEDGTRLGAIRLCTSEGQEFVAGISGLKGAEFVLKVGSGIPVGN